MSARTILVPGYSKAWAVLRFLWSDDFRTSNVHTSEFLLFTVSWKIWGEADHE